MTPNMEEIFAREPIRAALVNASRESSLTRITALKISTGAVRAALESWADDNQCNTIDVSRAFLDGAVATLINRCIDAHEDYHQLRLFDQMRAMGPLFERAQYLGDRRT